MNTIDRLVHMANHICANIATMAGDAAPAMLAEHVEQFWDPRMKSIIVSHVREGGAGLNPLPLAGLRRLAGDEIAAAPPPCRENH